MSSKKVPVNRTLVGVLALVCLGAAGGLWLQLGSDPYWDLWRGGLTRVGLVLAAFWLALPSRKRDAAWEGLSQETFIGMLLGVLALFALPMKFVLPVLAVVVIIGAMLRPKPKKRPRTRDGSRRSQPSSSPENDASTDSPVANDAPSSTGEQRT